MEDMGHEVANGPNNPKNKKVENIPGV